MWNSIKEVHKSLIKREISVTDLCNKAFQAIEQSKNLNAFITICENEATKRAHELDTKLLNQNGQNPLFGLPISVKDSFTTKDILTTCGSKMLHNFVPPYTATAVTKLLQSGCIMVGKTNMDEFAMGSSSTTSYYRPSANYWKHELLNGQRPGECQPSQWYMAGGSSTGSAVSVAAGACFASLGTDTGGSTRQPASLTGVVGFKPTYGLISRFGLIPLAHCLDVVSLLARTVGDVRLVFNAIVGQDENDLTTVDHTKELKTKIKMPLNNSSSSSKMTIRIGIPEEFVSKGDISVEVSNQYDKVIKLLSQSEIHNIKFEVINIDLPHSNLATECYTIISSTEIASNMSCYDGVKYGFSKPLDESTIFNRDEFYRANRDEGFGAEVKKRILLGNYFLLSGNREKYLVQALKLRRLITEDFKRAFEHDHVDVILTPSTPTTSISYAEWLEKHDKNKLFGEDYFLIPSNLANIPSISVPNGLSSRNLPFGLQLVANTFHDLDLLSISEFLETQVFPKSTWAQ